MTFLKIMMMCLSINLLILWSFPVNALNNKSIPEDAIQGDFDGDHKTEFAWITSNIKEPQTGDNMDECEGGDCRCIIHFSNSMIKEIVVSMCIGADLLQNEGDLNDDGGDDIALVPSWWTSCWQAAHIYTLKNQQWREMIKPFSIYCAQLEENPDIVRKVGHHLIEIEETHIDDDTFQVKKRTVKVK
ncbi:hypothetical protein BegalDRAFT_3385 [Beggiatoa alba B18LD]|uniref:Uncharacterized protein n=1 Tax=Beggiatoa alba B18LD TaxID=395493 RepID=I3CKR0_9GAMM|nr:hypothetical protein [Beggiatoa alba]EIJ44203.1 hypothetical protein BegalDRAFT_3385 [Beggiatoa alba B18LD]